MEAALSVSPFCSAWNAFSIASDVAGCALTVAAVPTVRNATSARRQIDMVPKRGKRRAREFPRVRND
jgi:hypothetical protein